MQPTTRLDTQRANRRAGRGEPRNGQTLPSFLYVHFVQCPHKKPAATCRSNFYLHRISLYTRVFMKCWIRFRGNGSQYNKNIIIKKACRKCTFSFAGIFGHLFKYRGRDKVRIHGGARRGSGKDTADQNVASRVDSIEWMGLIANRLLHQEIEPVAVYRISVSNDTQMVWP